MTIYIVSLREGSMCKNVGLKVEFKGHVAHVYCEPFQKELFWEQRLKFLKANPNN